MNPLTLQTPLEIHAGFLTDLAVDEVLTTAHAHRAGAPRLMGLLETAMIDERIRRREAPDSPARVTPLVPLEWSDAEIGQALLMSRALQEVISEETAWMLGDQLQTLFVFHAGQRLQQRGAAPLIAPPESRARQLN